MKRKSLSEDSLSLGLSAFPKDSKHAHRDKPVMDAAQISMEFLVSFSVLKKSSALEKFVKKAKNVSLMICAMRA